MNREAERLIRKYRRQGVLVDTNLWLLYFVGIIDRSYISDFKRTSIYTIEDFDILQAFLKRFSRIITTPHILTEVSNWLSYLPDHLKLIGFDRLAASVKVLLYEELFQALPVTEILAFRRYGLTDIGIQHIAKDRYLVLSDDLRLVGHLQAEGIDVLNFNHLRPYQLA
jgi:hypothetical protein